MLQCWKDAINFIFFEETNGPNPLHKKPIKNNQIGGMVPTLEHHPMTHKGNQSN
jgi:hypothetical protein